MSLISVIVFGIQIAACLSISSNAAAMDQILMVNGKHLIKGELPNVTNIDMVMPDDELGLQLHENRHGRAKRALTNVKWRLWENKILYYKIKDGSIAYSSEKKEIIRSAAKEIESRTCIKMKEYTAAPPSYGSYVEIFNGVGCWSEIGRTGFGFVKQRMSLQINGCIAKSVILHEFIHALGVWHEQARPDRDKYVQINYQNIKPGFQSNFNKRFQVDSLQVSYDYKSIMHYGNYFFSKNTTELMTIQARSDKNLLLGGDTLTDKDVHQLNLLYGCAELTKGVCFLETNSTKNWESYFDGCNTCNCTAENKTEAGNLTCTQKSCNPDCTLLRCFKKCPHGYRTDLKGCGKCKCKTPGRCYYDAKIIKHGKSFFDGCNSCNCTVSDKTEFGLLACSTKRCPKLCRMFFCRKSCKFGYRFDHMGCGRCVCMPKPKPKSTVAP